VLSVLYFVGNDASLMARTSSPDSASLNDGIPAYDSAPFNCMGRPRPDRPFVKIDTIAAEIRIGAALRCIYTMIMEELCFEWNAKKSRSNEIKHGVSFAEARTSFFDENARIIEDVDGSGNEERFVLLGLSVQLRVLVVCHCYKESDRLIRIISARKADPSERLEYARHLP
jgi:uncharacterized DUF497 family protein